MALSADRKARLAAFAGRRLARFVALVERTSTVVHEPADFERLLHEQHPFIMAMWHGQFMMLPAARKVIRRPVAAMVARHGDAELIGVVLQHFDIELIRGAGAGNRQKDRGGAQALRNALRALADGKTVCMTAEVPPGPPRQVGEGIITLARLSGRPIVPITTATSRFKSLDTWSRMTINLPFSRLAYVVGQPIYVPREADAAMLDAKRLEVEQALNAGQARAYELVGADATRATPVSALANAPPQSPGLLLKLYRGATGLCRPLLPLLLKMRERQGKEDRRRLGERFGVAGQARPDGPMVWVHAASVGETNAVLPVMDALAEARPELRFLLTTGTVTSAALAGQRLKGNAIHQYVPLDVPAYISRFLGHWKPDLVLFTESEIWPNTIMEVAKRGIPLALVNARLSKRSVGRWKRSRRNAQALFSRMSVVLAQNGPLGRRFSELGARRVVVAGNLKIDAPPPPVDQLGLQQLRTQLAGRPLFVAASTHDPEEKLIGQAHRLIAQRIEGFCTIIAPRHPERGTIIAEQLKSLGLNVVQRSTGAEPGPRTDVYIADTIGELGTFYALAPVAFIGGSLIAHGGQNPIEAIRHGAAVLTGPHWHNFQDSYKALLRLNGAREVKTAEDIAAAVVALLSDPDEAEAMRKGAGHALDTMSGALKRTTDALMALLPARAEVTRAS